MSLNIKNARVHELAKQAATVTGKTQTGAIEEALERLLDSYGADPEARRVAKKIDAVRSHVAAYAADHRQESPQISTPDDLFDAQTGLPR